jgi:hypothetical protein
MKNIKSIAELEEAILELEKKRVIQESMLKAQFEAVKDSLKPMNMLKTGISKITNNTEVSDGVIKTAMGVGLGLLTRNSWLGRTIPIVQTMFNTEVNKKVKEGVDTGTNALKAYGKAIYNNLFKKKAHSSFNHNGDTTHQ